TSPHTPLYSAKNRLIARVKEFLSQAPATSEISTLSFELEEIDLWRLLPYIDHAQKVYFRNRENTTEVLGIKFLRTFHSYFAIENARYLLDENKDLMLLGGQRFHTTQTPANEWSELGSHFY